MALVITLAILMALIALAGHYIGTGIGNYGAASLCFILVPPMNNRFLGFAAILLGLLSLSTEKFFRPCRDWRGRKTLCPSAKALGYFRGAAGASSLQCVNLNRKCSKDNTATRNRSGQCRRVC